MQFSYRLCTLMDIFRINNARLARGLGVDPSLISRWRSGERTPAKNTGAELAIGRFLSSQSMLPLDRAQLFQELGGSFDGRDELSEAIAAWLMGKTLDTAPPAANPNEGEQETERIISLISSRTGANASGPVNLWPLVSRGKSLEHEIFQGPAGKRQAMVNFLHSVLSSRAPTDVYMMDFEDYAWLEEDSLIKRQWERALLAMAAQGHTLSIICPEGSYKDLSGLLSRYLPFLRSGCRLFSCAAGGAMLSCVFAAKNIAAVVSYKTGSAPADRQTVYYSNRTDAEIFEGVVSEAISSSKELCSIYPASGMIAFAAKVASLSDTKSRHMALRMGFSPLWLPEQRLYSLLSGALPREEVTRLLDIFAFQRETFELAVADGMMWNEIIPLVYLDAAAQNGECVLSGSELFIGPDIRLSRDDIIACLTNLKQLLNTHPSFDVIFSANLSDYPGIILKPGHSACVYGFTGGERFGFFTSEPKFIDKLSAWAESIAVSSAKDGSKEKTLEEIDDALMMIEM